MFLRCSHPGLFLKHRPNTLVLTLLCWCCQQPPHHQTYSATRMRTAFLGKDPSPRTCVHSKGTQDFKETSLKYFLVMSLGTFSLSCKCHSCTPIFFGNIPKRLVIQQIPQFTSWSWACWLNVTVPISLQIWVCSLQTLSLACPIKLSNTLTGHNKNLPLKWFKTWNNLILARSEQAF